MDHEAATIREKAAYALGKIGPPAAAASGPLVAALDNSHERTRQRAADSLGWIRVANPEITAALLKTLSTDSPTVRAQAAWAWGHLGRPGAIPALMAALSDDSAHVRRQSAQALGALKARAATLALTRALKDDDPAVKRAAERALRKVNEASDK